MANPAGGAAVVWVRVVLCLLEGATVAVGLLQPRTYSSSFYRTCWCWSGAGAGAAGVLILRSIDLKW